MELPAAVFTAQRGQLPENKTNRGGGGASRATGQNPLLDDTPLDPGALKPDSLLDFPCFMSPKRPPTHHNHSHFFKKFELVSFDFRCLQLESFFRDIKKYSEYCLLCAEREGHVRYGLSTRGDGWTAGCVSRAPREK